MLTEIYIEALLVDEELADQVWKKWFDGTVTDAQAVREWCLNSGDQTIWPARPVMKGLLIMLLFALSSSADADCYCTCMNGKNQPICDNAYGIRPICGPRICPIEPPSIKPINPITIPPIGTEKCVQEYVWDHNYGKYVWKQICY